MSRLVIQNCNLAQGENLHHLSAELMSSRSLEFIDFQCNELRDKHVSSITKLICAQYETRDLLRWKLGLRSPHVFDISKLGIKVYVLSRNNFSDHFAEQLSIALKSEEYIKFICLKKNDIGIRGLKCLAEAAFVHPGLLSMDLRDNPGYKKKESEKFKEIMKKCYFTNIAHEVLMT